MRDWTVARCVSLAALMLACFVLSGCNGDTPVAPTATPSLTGQWSLASDRGTEECSADTNRPSNGLLDEHTWNKLTMIQTGTTLDAQLCDGIPASSQNSGGGLCAGLAGAKGTFLENRVELAGEYSSPPAPQGGAGSYAAVKLHGTLVGPWQIEGTAEVHRSGWSFYVPPGEPHATWSCRSTRPFRMTMVIDVNSQPRSAR